MRCEIVMGVAFHRKPRGLCCDPRECWAGSEQLPIPYLSISGADNLASAVTLVSGFSFFFFVCSFFAKVAYGVGLSAKSLAHQSKAKKPGHFFLSWHEKPQQYSGSVFFTRAFSKFGPELQQSALQPASAGALHRMPSSRKWSDLSIRKENQSWTSQNPKESFCSCFRSKFSLVQFLGAGQKVCRAGV